MNELTASDKSDLRLCEQKIETTKGAFVECGMALAKIRDGRLYRADYATFDDYCEKRWKWTRQRAQQLIAAATVVGTLPDCQPVVDSERVARSLAKVPVEARGAVLDRAKASGKVTAESITEAAKVEKVILQDVFGRVIPDAIVEDWLRAESTGAELRRKISDVKVAVESGITNQDTIYAELHNTDVPPLKAIYTTLGQIIPHALCTSCQGHGRKKCSLCKGKGYLSRFRFEQCVPAETKKLLERKK